MQQLSHERLDVYQRSTEFLSLAAQILDAMPKGHKTLSDQLRRASLSIVLNIAEAAGKPSRAEGRHHFAIARGSALECGAALDAVRLLSLGDKAAVEKGKEMLVSVVAMLSKLCRSQGSSFRGTLGAEGNEAVRENGLGTSEGSRARQER